MLRQVEAILKELLEPIRPAEENPEAPFRILLAVSGGIDSMCLADVLYRSGQFPFSIAHCNFKLRGEESDADEALVRGWARERGVRCHFVRFDTEKRAQEKGVSIEMMARELRYGWFRNLCRGNGYGAVVVAHHANDNAETLMLNLLRGAGLKGMLGMPMRGTLPVKGGASIPLLRPLLKTERLDIEEYVHRHKVPYREDHTNAENEFRRNAIRNQAFPVFQKINPSFVMTLNEDMQRLRIVDEIADDFYEMHKKEVWDGESIDIDRLKSLPHWEYVLFHILTENGLTPCEAQLAEDLLKGGRTVSGTTIGSGDKVLYGAYGRLIISEPREFWDESEPFHVTGPGTFSVGTHQVEVAEEPWDPGMETRQKPEDRCIIADARALPFPFLLRGWKQGDWFRPLGLHGRKKVQDLFTDLHLSLEEKHATLLVVRPDCPRAEKGTGLRDHISAVLPTRIDEKLRVTAETERIVRIRLR